MVEDRGAIAQRAADCGGPVYYRADVHGRDHEVEQLYVLAAERLREIYNAQRIARDQTTSLSEVCTQRRRCSTGREGPTLAEIEVALLQSPRRLRVGGQGFRLSYKERVAIEDRAMVRAQAWLEAQGYSVKDTHLNSPF